MSDQLLTTAADHHPPEPGGVLFDWRFMLRDTAQLLSIFRQTLYYSIRHKREPGSVLFQAYNIGNGSLLFVTLTMVVISMITVLQSAMQAMKVLPDLSLLGPTMIQLMLREFAATITAMMLATRVGAGIAAEIGSMVVTEQVDALRMSAADPVDYLVVPRFIASVIMTTALTFWCLAVSIAAGAATAYAQYDVGYHTFLDFSMIKPGDFVVCLLKAVAYGAAIPVVSAHRGLTTFGGSEGVGWATTNAVVQSSLTVITLDLILSILGYFAFPP